MLTQIATPLMNRLARNMLRFREEQVNVIPKPVAGRRYMLYVHVPYCEVLCPFCSFHRVKYQSDPARRYFLALRNEIRRYAALGFDFSEVYVGGGTPTVNLDELTETLALIGELFNIERISTETNPDHLTTRTFDALLECGVNRLSVGVQSFDDNLLQEMGRYDKYGSGDEIASRVSDAEGIFDTLNVDMIFNLPHQTDKILAQDVERLLNTGVGQASFYPLMSADSARHRMDKNMGVVTYQHEQRRYYYILDQMSQTHPPSSVWCFSRDGNQIDEYIIDHSEFVGVGSGAFSYLNGVLYATSFSINRYDDLLRSQHLGITRARPLTHHEQLQYHLLTALFGLSLDYSSVESQFGRDCFREVWAELIGLRLVGAISRSREGFVLTRRGMYYLLVAMRVFLTGVNNFRDEMRAHIKEEYEASYGDIIC